MKYAIVSDIHANMQAWEAVLNDSRIMSCEVILCLGDIVGYGPKPVEVLESVCTYAASIVLGDHDAVIGGHLESSRFSDDSRAAIEWTRTQISALAARLFADMEGYLQGEGFVICHSEMDLPERFSYIREPEQVRTSFEATTSPLIFAGHTHDPGVFTLDPTTDAITQSNPLVVVLEPEKRYFVNVGSVGYPSHGSTLATYIVYDSEARRITFRGVPFDLEAYAADVAASGLPVQPAFLPETPMQTTKPPPMRPTVLRDIGDEAAIQVPVVNPHRRSGPIRYVTPEELRDTTRTVRLKKYDSPLLRRDDPVTPAADTGRIEEPSGETVPQATAPSAARSPDAKKRKPIIIRKRNNTPPKPKIIQTPSTPYIPDPEPQPEPQELRPVEPARPDPPEMITAEQAEEMTASSEPIVVEPVDTNDVPTAVQPEPEPEPEPNPDAEKPITPPPAKKRLIRVNKGNGTSSSGPRLSMAESLRLRKQKTRDDAAAAEQARDEEPHEPVQIEPAPPAAPTPTPEDEAEGVTEKQPEPKSEKAKPTPSAKLAKKSKQEKPKKEKRGLFGFGKKADKAEREPTLTKPEEPAQMTAKDKKKVLSPSSVAKEEPKKESPASTDAMATAEDGVSAEEKETLRKERSRKLVLAAQKRKQQQQARKSDFQNKLRDSLKARQEAALKKRKEAESNEAQSDEDTKSPDNA